MDQATTSGFTQKQYLMMTGFVIIVVVGAFAYFNGFLGGGTRAMFPPRRSLIPPRPKPAFG
jgi:hypothetical protein